MRINRDITPAEAGKPLILPVELGHDEHVVVVADRPDVVTLPPELGGSVVRVTAAYLDACACNGAHDGVHYATESPYSVCACRVRNQFLWYTPRAPVAPPAEE